MKTIHHQVEFCVVGGGLAGMCAAIAAARHGVKTLLMHERPMLGGNASSEIRMFVCGAYHRRETGLIEEIRLDNCHRNPRRSYPLWDALLFEKVKFQENLTVLLNCSCMDAQMSGNKVKSVKGWQLTTQQFHEVRADYFADCSGDSILAELTGADFRVGREASGELDESLAVKNADRKTMGMSCLLQARQTDSPKPYTPPPWAKKVTEEDLASRYHDFSPYQNFWYLELGGDQDSIADTESVRDELIALAYGMWDHIKNSGTHDAENWELDWVGFLPGKRESRRYMGDYILTQNDLLDPPDFPDTVAFGGWPVDDHHPGGLRHHGEPNQVMEPEKAYNIPARSLYSRNIDNLLFAGRNISASHIALSSTRVMATCALCGQAAGTIAARANAGKLTPRQAVAEHISDIQQILLDDDCFIPNLKRQISGLSRCAELTVSQGDGEALRNGVDGTVEGSCNCWSGKAGDFAEYTFAVPQEINRIRIVFDSDRSRLDSLNTLGLYYLEREDFTLPPTLVRAFHIEVDGKEVFRTDDNHQRLVRIPFSGRARSVKLVLDDAQERKVFAFEVM